MSLADLRLVLDWAAAEGWNPGLGDAEAFYAADPGGFLIGRVGGAPVAAVSVVRHDPGFAFLGLYLCHPDWRGRGHGWAIWQAGLSLAGGRTIGLDGVAAQRKNYRRSGFVGTERTIRHAGAVPISPPDGLTGCAREDVAALDLAATGVDRTAFLSAWLADTAERRSLCLWREGAAAAFGTVRRCREGVKVGPLMARRPEDARRVLAALAGVFPDRPVVIDIPETNAPALALAESFGMRPVFETARMYRGPAPAADPALTWGVATLELG